MSSNEVVIINKEELMKELHDLIYERCKMANNHQYKGIAIFLYQFEKEFRTIITQLDEIKTLLQSTNSSTLSENESKKLKDVLGDNLTDKERKAIEDKLNELVGGGGE